MPRKLTYKALQSSKSTAAQHKLHPNSRRAKQFNRVDLRTKKLATKESERRDLEASRMERHLWLIDALQDSAALASLSTMHSLVQAWLARNDDEIDELEKARKERGSWRKAEGKSQRQMNLEAQRETDALEYKSGFLMPDLMNAANVQLGRQWLSPDTGMKSGDPSFFPRIRLVRISSTEPEHVGLAHEGVADKMESNAAMDADDDDDDA